jgi:DNA-binding response OmpR family regulator
MSGDLVSLRLLLIAATGHQYDVWRDGAAQASVPIDFDAGDAAAARVMLAKGGIDICVLDAALSNDDKAAVIRSARKAKAPAPVIFMTAPCGAAYPENTDGTLPKPANAAQASKLVEICIRVKMPTKVLIAGDSDTTRAITRKILDASRFTLDIHESTESYDALSQLRAGEFGLVFLDRAMPGLNGADPLMQIKREISGLAIVVMVTPQEGAAAGRKLSGTLALLEKPFYPADVEAVLKRYYGLHAFEAS